MIGDYTERGLQDLLATEPGQNLIRLVDPLAAIRDLRAPVFSITGTNDPYWTVDSTQVYWDRIPSPKWTLAVPNSGHVLTEKAWWLNALGQFATQCSRSKVQNLFSTSTQPNGLEVHCAVPPTSYRVWKASSSDLHFDEKKWTAEDPVTLKSTDDPVLIRVEVLRDTNTALFVEMEFPGGLRLTTPVHLVRKK